MISELGPLPSSDSKYMRRIRVHQAWYRSSVLGVAQYGRLAGSQQPCGSILPDDAAARFMNFHSDEAITHYKFRRKKGWGVEPVRCTSYLTSSQTLTFNMLGPVVERPSSCAILFNAILGRTDLVRLDSFDFEYSAFGTPLSLGDRTLVDLLLRFITDDKGVQVVAVETKLGDRFSTRRTAGMNGNGYRDLAASRGLWDNMERALADNRTRQLTRCHALAESVQRNGDRSGLRNSILLVLHHELDASAAHCLDTYRKMMCRPRSLAGADWNKFSTHAVLAGALDPQLNQTLRTRYIDLDASEDHWRQLDALGKGIQR